MKAFMPAIVLTLTVLSVATAPAAEEKPSGEGLKTYPLVFRKDPKTSNRSASVKFIVDAPPSKVWETLNDFKGYKQFMPHMMESKVTKTGESPACRFVLRVALVKVWYAVQFERKQAKQNMRLSWHYLEGSLKDTHGSWSLTPTQAGDQTLVQYDVSMNPGRFMPGWVTNLLLKKSIPDLIEAVRTRTQQG